MQLGRGPAAVGGLPPEPLGRVPVGGVAHPPAVGAPFRPVVAALAGQPLQGSGAKVDGPDVEPDRAGHSEGDPLAVR